MISEAIAGVASGGLLRMAPELLRYMNARDERKHELAMQELEVEMTTKLWGQAQPAPAPVLQPGALDALRALHLDRQVDRAGRRFPFLDVLSSLVRPSTTWTLLALYVCVRLFAIGAGKEAYGAADMELLSTVLSYWFVSRTLEKK